MKAYDSALLRASQDMLGDTGGVPFPILADYRPVNAIQPEFRKDPLESGRAQSKGRAEQSGSSSCRVGDHALRSGDFLADASSGTKGQERVRVGVVADCMPGLDNRSSDARAALHVGPA